MDIGDIMEEERVAHILRELREGHKDDDYRRAILIELFNEGRLKPINDHIH